MSGSTQTAWREARKITDHEFSEVGVLLCDHEARDLALMVVRLRAALELARCRIVLADPKQEPNLKGNHVYE